MNDNICSQDHDQNDLHFECHKMWQDCCISFVFITSYQNNIILNTFVFQIVEPSKGKVVFLNPLGASPNQKRTVLLNWR